MKLTRLLVAVAVVLVFSGVALADTTDPAIGVKGGGGSQVLFGPTFSFTFFGGTTQEQDFDFINSTGFTVAEIDLIAPGPLTYACGDASTYFSTCQPTPLPSGQTLIRYSGGGGIPNDPNPNCGEFGCSPSVAAADFVMFVQDINGDLGNLPSTDSFTVTGTLLAAPVPEPATILLLSTGLGYVGLLRRRKNAKTANSSL